VNDRTIFLLTAISLLGFGCTPDRDLTEVVKPFGRDSIGFEVNQGTLVINEFVASGSQNTNEFGSAEDWLELYNPNDFNAVLESGKWFLTDRASSEPMKFQLPQCTIPSHGFLLVWCDGLNTEQEYIHANFSLSSSGEELGIYFKSGIDALMVDEHEFPAQQQDAVSNGRYPDGGASWTVFNTPTPGSSNN